MEVVWEARLLEEHPDKNVQRELTLQRLLIEEEGAALVGNTWSMPWTSSPIGPRDFKARLFFTGSRFNTPITVGIGQYDHVAHDRVAHNNAGAFVIGLGSRAVSAAGEIRQAARVTGPDKIPAGSTIELWKDGCRLLFRATTPGVFETDRETVIDNLPDSLAHGRWCLVASTASESCRIEIGSVQPLRRWWSPASHHRHSSELRRCVEAVVLAVQRGTAVEEGARAVRSATLRCWPGELTAMICRHLAAADFYYM